jgi:hypothetical protein
MKFLVIGHYIDPGPMLPPDQLGPLAQHVILPSLEMLADWEKDGKITGGIFAGQRAGAFVIDSPSHEALGDLLASLPFWGVVKWDVTPLQSVRSAVKRDRVAFKRATAM